MSMSVSMVVTRSEALTALTGLSISEPHLLAAAALTACTPTTTTTTASTPTPTTTTTTTTTTAAATAATATTADMAFALPFDQPPQHSFTPFPPDTPHNSLDSPVPVLHAHHAHSASSPSSSFPSSSSMMMTTMMTTTNPSTSTSTRTSTESGEHDTSPSSAPSLLNDTSPSLPQTPSSASAHSHFPLDLHSTDFSAAPSKPVQPQYHFPTAPDDEHSLTLPCLTAGRGVFPLFLAQRSSVLKLLNLPLDPDNLLASLFTSSTALHHSACPAEFWSLATLATHPAVPRSPHHRFLWLVYQHHEQALAALSSLSTTLGSNIVPALEDDLKPLEHLCRLDIRPSTDPAPPLSTLRHRATAPSSMHQISLAQAQAHQPFPSIPIRAFSHTTPTPTPPRQNPRLRMHPGSPLASDVLSSPSDDDHPDQHDDPLGSSKTKTPTVPPLRPRLQPPLPHMLPAAAIMDDMADLSRIGVLRATASMGDLHSRGQLPPSPSPYTKPYPSPLAASPTNAQSASTGTCTPNSPSTMTMTTTAMTTANNNNNASLGFTLSTNPPAPRATAFRQGDWMCTAPGCGAHNFGRNSSCIGCGWARVHQQQSLGGSNAATTATATAAAGAAATAVFGGGNLGGVTSTNNNMNIGPRGGMGMGLGMAYPSGAGGGGGGARPAVGNGIPRFASASASASGSTPTADVNGLENAISNLGLHPSAVQALGGPGGLNALQAAIMAHQQQQQQSQARGVVDRPKVPHATIHGNNNNSSNGNDAAAVAALNALQGLPAVGASRINNGMPFLIPTTIAGSGNSPMVPSTVPGQTQGFNSLQQQLTQLQQQQQQQQTPVLHPLPAAAAPPLPQAPYALPSLLTPSGRQIAQGGSVRNVSGDDTNPIFMFWPDNEPLPDPGQCRPTSLFSALGSNGSGPLPPILNTGNKGPIESQPGDWTCRKCEYLNWRRRRVCALCFPHAEGNSEGTRNASSDVQERVTFLASLLAHQMQAQMTQQPQPQQQQQQQVLPQAQQPQPQSSFPAFGQRSLMRANSLPIGGVVGAPECASGGTRVGTTSTRQPQRMHPQALLNFTPPPDETSTYHGLSSQKPAAAGLSVNIPTRSSLSNGASSRSGGYLETLNKDAPLFTPLSARAGNFGFGSSMSLQGFDSAPGSGKPSPPSSANSRSSFAIPIQAPPTSSSSRAGTNFSVEDKTPSPLPLLPSFMHEMVGGDSSTQPSPSTGTDGWPSRRLTPSTEGSEDSHSYRSRSSIASSFGGPGVEYPLPQQRFSSLSHHRPIVKQPSAPSGWARDVGFFRDATTTASK